MSSETTIIRMREQGSCSAVKSCPLDVARDAGRRRFRAGMPLTFLAAVGVLVTSLTATRAESASTPDSARVALVRLAVVTFDDIRVVTDSTKLLVRHVVVSPDGLHLPLTSDGAFSSGFASTTHVGLVPWTKIESIDARRSSRVTGTLVGAFAGLAIGVSIVLMNAEVNAVSFNPHSISSGAPIYIGLLGGAMLGSLANRPGPWTTVYP